jgi:hypothetical protein
MTFMFKKIFIISFAALLQLSFADNSCFVVSNKSLQNKCPAHCCCKGHICKCGHADNSKGKSSESKGAMCNCSPVPNQEKPANLSSYSNTDVQKQLKSNPILIGLEGQNNSLSGYLFHNLSPCCSSSHSIPLRI